MRTFLSGLLVLFLCAGCSMFETQETSLIVGSFNIRVNMDKSPHTWKERKPRCREVIAKNQFDIFGVQEALHYQLTGLVSRQSCRRAQTTAVGLSSTKSSVPLLTRRFTATPL